MTTPDITLYQFPTHLGLPNLSPFCMKVEAILKLLKLPYQIEEITDLEHAPRHQVPYVKINNVVLGDSQLIIEQLQKLTNTDLDAHLDVVEKAQAHAIRIMIEEHLCFAMIYSHWLDEQGSKDMMDTIFAGMPAEMRAPMEADLKQMEAERIYAQGLGRHDPAQIYQFAVRDIQALSNLLADKDYLFGTKPCLCDYVLYSFIANLAIAGIDTPLAHQTRRYENLIQHAQRLHKQLFPETTPLKLAA